MPGSLLPFVHHPATWVIFLYGIMSLATFCVYGWDKARAGTGKRRVSEKALHLLALGAGWPGAWAGQQWFRHKTKKVPFQVTFWLIVSLHVLVWAWVAWYKLRPNN